MDVKAAFSGAADFLPEEDGFFMPVRHGKDKLAYYKTLPNFAYALASGGVIADFYTASEEISFEYIIRRAWTSMFRDSAPTFDFFVNGVLTDSKELDTDGKAHFVSFRCGKSGKNRITVVFPANASVSVGNADFGDFTPAEKSKRTVLVLGDSVGGGFMNNSASNNFPFLLKRFFGFDYINQSSGGDMFDENLIEYIPEITDVIVELGLNEMVFTKNIRKTEARIKAFFKRLSELYGDRDVYVITPTYPIGADERDKELLCEISEAAASEAKRCGFRIICGENLIPHDKRYYSDSVHPNDLGFAHLSMNLIKEFVQYVKI